MFGKFHAEEEETSRAGARIPAAPVSFLPVRAAVRRRDPRFLTTTPYLAAALAGAEDDGRGLLGHGGLNGTLAVPILQGRVEGRQRCPAPPLSASITPTAAEGRSHTGVGVARRPLSNAAR
jgi:hypothetical protein